MSIRLALEVQFRLQIGPLLAHFGYPKDPRRHPKSGTFLGGPKMTSKIAGGGGPLGHLGPPSLILIKHSTKYFRTVQFPSCSRASWRKVRPPLTVFCCFFFELLTASFRARGVKNTKKPGGSAHFFKKTRFSLRGVSWAGGRRGGSYLLEIEAAINILTELISSAI